MPNLTNTEDLRSKIRLLYNFEKTRDQALELEANLNRTINIGSIVCDIELEHFITQDPEMLRMKEMVRKIVNLDDPVLIQGESGTGKSIIARALHGSRRGKFVHVNCTSMPDELIESELFGHVKGSFTGAISDRIGKFQAAAGGTLFLDEIGDMPMNMQTKLLLAIENKKICPVGCNDEVQVNCRIVCATNQNVREKIRNDLYWRLSVFEIQVSPLRARPSDILLIVKSIDPDFLNDYDNIELAELPGNVRELQRMIKRWKVLSE